MNNPSKEFEFIRLYPNLSTDPLSGRVGEMYYNTTLNTVRLCVATTPTWTTIGAGANQSLSNLTTVLANASLNPQAANTLTLGTTALPWLSSSITTLKDATALTALAGSGLTISTTDVTGSTNSGTMSISSGGVVDGISGDVDISTGNVSGAGSRGSVKLSGLSAQLGFGMPLLLFESTNTWYSGLQANSALTMSTVWTLPLADGTSGQAIVTNGFGILSFATVTPTGTANTSAYFNNSGVLSSNPSAKFTDSLNARIDVINVGGTATATGEGAYAHGFVASSGALNAGGRGSIAQGESDGSSNIGAGGVGSFVGGIATGGSNIAAGQNGAWAHGDSESGSSISTGGEGAEAGGYATSSGVISAAGRGSKAFGEATNNSISTSASGALAHGQAIGSFSILASGIGSHASGMANTGAITASGLASFVKGDNSVVSSDLGVAFGLGHANSSYASLAIGRFSVDSGTTTSWVSGDPLFVIGIGTGTGARANAFKVQKDGSLFILDPSLGSAVAGYVWTLQNATSGLGAWSVGTAASGTTPRVEYRTLTSGEATAKQITLANTPFVATKTLLDIIGGDAQQYSVDYTVSGATLSWSGLGLDGVLTTGDTLRVLYWT